MLFNALMCYIYNTQALSALVMLASVIKHIPVGYQSYTTFLSNRYMIVKGSEMFDTEHSYVFHLNIKYCSYRNLR